MMEVMAPGHQFEEEVSSAEGRQAYLRDAESRGSRKAARKAKIARIFKLLIGSIVLIPNNATMIMI